MANKTVNYEKVLSSYRAKYDVERDIAIKELSDLGISEPGTREKDKHEPDLTKKVFDDWSVLKTARELFLKQHPDITTKLGKKLRLVCYLAEKTQKIE